jgi:hypothetical protein
MVYWLTDCIDSIDLYIDSLGILIIVGVKFEELGTHGLSRLDPFSCSAAGRTFVHDVRED